MCSVPSMRLGPGLRYCLVAASPSFFGGPRFSSRTSQVTVYYTVGNGVSSASPPGSCCVGSPNSGGYGSGSAARAVNAAGLVLLALAGVAAAAVLAPLWHA
ncbi:hypothetical protein HYH03_002032 [Edaphochlamys debaryana]|uniref:Uncharacterized protein n=1 Tax=Edaphochlamys debaryana TaxID=47281 RepID=A0A835YKY2_9CHLO|nr:hypothetical protein HYH03_002032 [Edaphochlamys debaryana]|eukprot:KAG2500465.1 hypothetical protein HYH03_002032 [Edaphochlamys debaryana]